MITRTDDRFYSKTEAYNFLKELLGVSECVKIPKNFFLMFFEEIEGSFYIKDTEENIKKLFEKENLRHLNNVYFENKTKKLYEKARQVYKIVVEKVNRSMLPTTA